jgi:phosphopantetheinyl transferase
LSTAPSALHAPEDLHTHVQVLVLRFAPTAHWPTHLANWLDTPERDRLARFRYAEDRALYALAHLWLRHALSHATGIAPHALSFEQGTHGKPCLRQPDAAAPLHFNLSHTQGCIALALTRLGEVGVDAECHTAQLDLPALKPLVLHPDECATVQTADDFVRYWVMKEAHVKAQGAGLSQPLTQLRINIGPDDRFTVHDESLLPHPPTTSRGVLCQWPAEDILPTCTLACCIPGQTDIRIALHMHHFDTQESWPPQKTNEPAMAGSFVD